MSLQDAGLLELSQYPVHGGKAYIHAFARQQAINLLGRQMTHFAGLKQPQDAQSRRGDLEAMSFKIGDIAHGVIFLGWR